MAFFSTAGSSSLKSHSHDLIPPAPPDEAEKLTRCPTARQLRNVEIHRRRPAGEWLGLWKFVRSRVVHHHAIRTFDGVLFRAREGVAAVANDAAFQKHQAVRFAEDLNALAGVAAEIAFFECEKLGVVVDAKSVAVVVGVFALAGQGAGELAAIKILVRGAALFALNFGASTREYSEDGCSPRRGFLGPFAGFGQSDHLSAVHEIVGEDAVVRGIDQLDAGEFNCAAGIGDDIASHGRAGRRVEG